MALPLAVAAALGLRAAASPLGRRAFERAVQGFSTRAEDVASRLGRTTVTERMQKGLRPFLPRDFSPSPVDLSRMGFSGNGGLSYQQNAAQVASRYAGPGSSVQNYSAPIPYMLPPFQVPDILPNAMAALALASLAGAGLVGRNRAGPEGPPLLPDEATGASSERPSLLPGEATGASPEGPPPLPDETLPVSAPSTVYPPSGMPGPRSEPPDYALPTDAASGMPGPRSEPPDLQNVTALLGMTQDRLMSGSGVAGAMPPGDLPDEGGLFRAMMMGDRPQEGSDTYRVREGDNLWDIANQLYGDATLWPVLWEQNAKRLGIQDPNQIQPGMDLQVRRPPEMDPGRQHQSRQLADALLAGQELPPELQDIRRLILGE